MDNPVLPPKPDSAPKGDPNINFFGGTNFRNQNRRFGIKIDDRRRHMYVVGKTGMGKTTILENMVLNDIYAGHGVGLVDPHGDFAEKIIDFVPAHRINDVVYFNPADINFPIGFNILETVNPEHRHLVASGLMGVFKKIWPDVWSARMEYILNNTILALLEYPGTTLLGINRLLAEDDYRKRVVNVLKDPVVKAFWMNEFANYTDKFRTEAVAPIQNKIGQFLSASVIRNIVAQVKSRINIREIMDNRKIFIMNLSKGRIGEDNSRLLGGMLITKIQLAAMERVDISEKDRKDFFLYVDEFQNFANESFANILSEARKYRLDLIMAHQYMEQLEEEVLAAVIGNVGTMVTFRVGSTDAEILAKEFAPTFIEEDLINLPKFQIYLKLMIDGVASRPFSATTLPPIGSSTASTEKVIRVSRERYAVPREKIEDKIMRWSGFGPAGSEIDGDEDEDYSEPIFSNAPAPAVVTPPPLPKVVPVLPPPKAATPPPPAPSQPQPVRSSPPPAQPPAAPVAPNNQPPVRPPSPQGGQQMPRGGQSGGQGGHQGGGQQGQPGQPGLPGQGKKKRKKKKKGGGGGGLPPGSAETILLGDPGQKGMSLSDLNLGDSFAPPKQQPPAHQPPERPRPAAPLTPPQPAPITPPPSAPPATPAPSKGAAPDLLDLGFIPSTPAEAPPQPPAKPPVAPTPPPPSLPPYKAAPTAQDFEKKRREIVERQTMADISRNLGGPPTPPKTLEPGKVVKIDDQKNPP